ncbi:2Fe-2S iron-sulfur cluster-binding protein [Alisedimentitalea sp. MJ-SS2]|uniref:2Fe-2S iron-sulfur cluster-binding protein n=1 Tax=Aliisedimentitalea sp. MJ-SS2 TaxID=3049795 RepID=UPI00290CF57E|nr:2Fe-2S iron-sulfur cluster-binding protein [Alisedimentitalea sp. MJ-SS2]MDU8927997.1 2Fe-2S iron-sulfur cluster-binding protein [Alisedimentitalea sp. MJ-SS2]
MKITFELADGSEIVADAEPGMRVKDAALAAGVPQITGDCGGNLSCATCHVLVTDDWVEKVGQPGEMEDVMLDMTAVARQDHSRLSCQIEMTEALAGLRVRVPE